MTRFAVLLLVVTALAACKKAQEPEPVAPRERPIVSDGTAMGNLGAMPDRVQVKADLGVLRGMIRTFSASHDGALPKSLTDVELDSPLKYPTEYSYDASSGTVTSRTYPDF